MGAQAWTHRISLSESDVKGTVQEAGTSTQAFAIYVPCAVFLTAAATIWSASIESLLWLFVDLFMTSPTESVAAALFAVVVALHSSARDEAAVRSALDSVIETVKARSDDMADKLSQVAENMNYGSMLESETYANSIQTLRSSVESVQQSLAASSWLAKPSAAAGAARRASAGRSAGSSLETHAALRDIFLQCCAHGDGPYSEHLASRLFAVGSECDFPPPPDAPAEVGKWREMYKGDTERASFRAWFLPFRKGLRLYKTRSTFQGVNASQYLDFLLDDAYRAEWDANVGAWGSAKVDLVMEGFPRPCRADCSGAAGVGAAAEGEAVRVALSPRAQARQMPVMEDVSCSVQLPPPVASRQYHFRRSAWRREDGEGEVIGLARPPTRALPYAGRSVTVEDYMSCCAVRNVAGRDGGPAVEVTYMYYEDTCLPSAIVNGIVRRKMVNFFDKNSEALFRHVQAGGRVHSTGAAKRLPAPSGRPGGLVFHSKKGGRRHPLQKLAVRVFTVLSLVRNKWAVPIVFVRRQHHLRKAKVLISS